MRQFLSLFVIVAVFGCISATLSQERTHVEHVLSGMVAADGENPTDFGKEAHLINSHLNDEQVHKLIVGYNSMTPEQQTSFKAKLVQGGKAAERAHGADESSVLRFIKKAYEDSKK